MQNGFCGTIIFEIGKTRDTIKNRLIGVVILELLYARAAARNCLIGAIIFELRRESFETQPPPRGDENSTHDSHEL